LSLTIKTRDKNGAVIVDLDGRLTLGEATGMLRETIRDLIANKKTNIVLNLKNLEYIDSAGLGELVSAYTSAKNAGGQVKMVNVWGRALDLLQVTKLMTLFELYGSEEEAVKSFG